MKTLHYLIVNLAFVVVPGLALASPESPIDSDDTIPAVPRHSEYYYTKWFDECPNYYPDGVVDSCFCRYFQFHNFYGEAPIAKWEHTNSRMRVKGVVAMLRHYNPPTDDNSDTIIKLPEYLYIYQYAGRHQVPNFPNIQGVDLVLLDSVRWDTATARVMEYRRGWNGEYTQYCYLYEAYFETPVYVDSDFYIQGSTNCNYPGSNRDGIIPTVYLDIMDFNAGTLKPGCDMKDYREIAEPTCTPEGGYVAITEMLLPELGWHTPWPDSPWGYFLPIVDQWNLEAVPDSTSHGEVIGGGRWPDDSYDTIKAEPSLGYRFVEWNDGNTENPRVVHLVSDTSFVAHFGIAQTFDLTVSSSDETQGSAFGGGNYYHGTNVTITAVPEYGFKFTHWSSGGNEEEDNPLVVHLVSDTTFVAHFAEKRFYHVQVGVNNAAWGSVSGGGVYMEGDQADLTVTTAPFCVFEGWSDGDMQNPRPVTVLQDTTFTAVFSFDSAWAASVDMAGELFFTVAPNPTTGQLTVKTGQSGEYELAVYDMNGKKMMATRSQGSVSVIDIGKLPAGKYLLMVSDRVQYGIKPIVKK